MSQFWDVSCDAWANFVRFSVVFEVGMISVDEDGDFSSFEQVRPAAKASKDSQEFSVIDGVISFCAGETLQVETAWSSGSWFLSSIW